MSLSDSQDDQGRASREWCNAGRQAGMWCAADLLVERWMVLETGNRVNTRSVQYNAMWTGCDCLSMGVCVFDWLYVCGCGCLYVWLSVCLWVYLVVCLSVSLPCCLSVCESTLLYVNCFVCLCLSVCCLHLFVCMSACKSHLRLSAYVGL